MPVCAGNEADHCCYTGTQCKYLEENTVPGRRWACGLYRELGSWKAVHADPRYVADVKSYWLTSALAAYDCGEWPPPGFTCPTCGVSG